MLGKMIGPALLVVSSTLASAVGVRSRAAARAHAMSHLSADSCGEGVTTTPLLIYASMNKGNQLYSLRGMREGREESESQGDLRGSEESESQESELASGEDSELASGEDLMTESGNKTGDDKKENNNSPLCLALFKSIRDTGDEYKVKYCINQHKEKTKRASEFLQEFDADSAQQVLEPTLAKCLRSEINLPTAQLMEAGGCFPAFTADFVQWEMKNKGKGISLQCKAEACIKYNTVEGVEDCAHKFDDELENVENMEEAAKAYEKLLTQCAGVSDLCARQNGYPMAFKANQNMLKQIGIVPGR